ncbi:hypothetical protein BDB00DRAFT_871390 [Zychaea mexicana]|uniref:uncharacterized protein n=1 Tax=Zychaea mexicana TaxID=64656 RepID=UPI0022FEE8BE|nr:uncharacterized protein BDB00DRAFT_871390 [Zychaea mexicana]KAI9494568.1 hypothetical protein BDB00DRAFT_871390 [Zychaea mexicana]
MRIILIYTDKQLLKWILIQQSLPSKQGIRQKDVVSSTETTSTNSLITLDVIFIEFTPIFSATIIKTLIAQNGPMTTKALASYIPQFETQLISTSHIKNRVLPQLRNSGILTKTVHREPSALSKGVANSEKSKSEVFVWKFVDPSLETKYKSVQL